MQPWFILGTLSWQMGKLHKVLQYPTASCFIRGILYLLNPFPLLESEYHDSPSGGHVGEVKTYQRLAFEWYLERALAAY